MKYCLRFLDLYYNSSFAYRQLLVLGVDFAVLFWGLFFRTVIRRAHFCLKKQAF